MSDQVLGDPLQDTSADKSPSQAGAMLREAREAQGLHIAALAVALKVTVKKLEALEAGRFEELPDMVFARSLALSVCRSLKVDPAPIMASLPESKPTPFKAKETDLNTTFKESGPVSHRGWQAQISTPLGLAVVFIVVAISAIVFWPNRPLLDGEGASTTSASLPLAFNEPPTALPSEVDVSASGPSGLATPLPATGQQVAALAAPPAVPVSNVEAVASTGPAATLDPQASAPSAVLELSGLGESWVEVTDATGQSKLRRIILNGEMIRVAGQLPLSVTVGRADRVSVAVRGKPLDLTPLARDNVARFEVK
ncbi:DUF4115 domain-containing protein [Rhodoferax sp. U2-2l]|uniref:RodZ domain-containing protein n=1 Tax=Rhodoferax sp. U2-2l TaxID=2884000 RepID=UPI001D0B7CF6|nr:RodZ domain-containing protein [Rhodoferax sp. U2-2l]MCB8747932.1 DUF4115 domain-containing protein [Rhodoferax sp. U2-2l]